MPKPVKPAEAFEAYFNSAIIQTAFSMTDLSKSLLMDCFMAGCGYAIERCKAEHHQPNATSH